MSAEKIRERRHQVSLQYWMQVVAEQADSGQTVRAFCQENNIRRNKYYYWLRIIREAVLKQEGTAVPATPTGPGAVSFAPLSSACVTPSSPSSTLRLCCGCFELVVHEDTPPDLLRSVLSVMREVQGPCS